MSNRNFQSLDEYLLSRKLNNVQTLNHNIFQGQPTTFVTDLNQGLVFANPFYQTNAQFATVLAEQFVGTGSGGGGSGGQTGPTGPAGPPGTSSLTGATGPFGATTFTWRLENTAQLVGSNNLLKEDTASDWDSGAFSDECYLYGAFMSFQPSQSLGHYFIAGLTENTGAINQNGVDYSWFVDQFSGNCFVYQFATIITATTYVAGDTFQVYYDSVNVYYVKNGTIYHTTARTPYANLYLGVILGNNGTQVNNIHFGPMGAAGSGGGTGAGSNIENWATYRILTSTGPSTAYGSDNLTFNGTDLNLTGTSRCSDLYVNNNIIHLGTSAGTGTNSVSVGREAGFTSQSFSCVAIGRQAGYSNQSNESVAIGRSAGFSNQSSSAVAIGLRAAQYDQQSESVALGFEAGRSSQSNGSIAIGRAAGQSNQSNFSVAIGHETAQSNQSGFSVAIGNASGQSNQGQESVAIGHNAGNNTQGSRSIAIGENCGNEFQSSNSIAIGDNCAATSQGSVSIAIGYYAGLSNQLSNSIAIGPSAAAYNQGSYSIAIGSNAGLENQATETVALGNNAGRSTQSIYGIAIGSEAGRSNQGQDALAIGLYAGNTLQAQHGIAIGTNAGSSSQGFSALALGNSAGQTNQSSDAVALGEVAGNQYQGTGAVALGTYAGNITQGTYAIAIGYSCASNFQGLDGIAIGRFAGQQYQTQEAIAIGYSAGTTSQATHTIAIGSSAGSISQQAESIAIGTNAGYINQSTYCVSIGNGAGFSSQGTYSVAIGYNAGNVAQHANTIVLSGLSTALNTTTTGAFYVAPVRSDINNNFLTYNSSTYEVNVTSSRPMVSRYSNAAQTLLDVTNTRVSFDTQDLSVGTISLSYDSSTNIGRFTSTSTETKVFQINVTLSYSTFVTGFRRSTILLNGSKVVAQQLTDANSYTAVEVSINTNHCISAVVALAPTQYFEIFAFQESGSTLSLGTGTSDDNCYISIVEL